MRSEHQPYQIGRCIHCTAEAWYNPDLERTQWENGPDGCPHELYDEPSGGSNFDPNED